jgi:hypothetical protein
MMELAEDRASNIGDAIRDALDKTRRVLDDGATIRIRWRNDQLLPDSAEADAFHAMVNLNIRRYA